ncbi:MAG: hypothetical protein JKY37_22530 [Nannocystaceae bacterium]|nr:hypothetical protein [Nannocystaceae bacterium]
MLTPAGEPGKGYTGAAITAFYAYTLARALLKYGADLHAGVQMGNHLHNDITDRLANRPNFKNSVHSNLARGINARRGRNDSLFAGGGSCDTLTPADEQTLNDLAYTDTNPVVAGLVKWGHLWPGFTTYGWKFGETRVFRRPNWYYDPANPDNPESVAITRVRPKILLELTDDELFDKLMDRCRQLERDKQAQMKAENRRFMGLSKLSKSKWWRKPSSWEDRYAVKPKVASSDKWKRIAELVKNQHWACAYAKARDEYRAGDDPVFPYGTYLLRVRYEVRVADQPP